MRLEQGDTGDGRISRDSVAAAIAAAFFDPAAVGKTFEVYDDPGAPFPDRSEPFTGLAPDGALSDVR